MGQEGLGHRPHVPVECPVCHWRYFQEVDLDGGNFPLAREIRAHLEAWLASRCPEHLGPFLQMSKN
jgi:hypothetical protein